MLPEWFKDIVTAGPAFIFAVLWWLERTERREEREEHKTVSREMIQAMVKTENTLATIGNVFSSRPNP
jgi:hypothetical protein